LTTSDTQLYATVQGAIMNIISRSFRVCRMLRPMLTRGTRYAITKALNLDLEGTNAPMQCRADKALTAVQRVYSVADVWLMVDVRGCCDQQYASSGIYKSVTMLFTAHNGSRICPPSMVGHSPGPKTHTRRQILLDPLHLLDTLMSV